MRTNFHYQYGDFAAFLGIATLRLRKDNGDIAERISQGIESLNKLVMSLVRIVISLTPYGILALADPWRRLPA